MTLYITEIANQERNVVLILGMMSLSKRLVLKVNKYITYFEFRYILMIKRKYSIS